MAAPKGQEIVQRAFEEICNRVIEDKISFKKAVDESDISLVTFYKQLLRSEENKDLYNYARNIRSDVLFEEIVEIADTTEEGTVIKETDRGVEVKRGDMTEHRRLRVDARKWVVARMNPLKYGDKIDVTSKGEQVNTITGLEVK